MILNNIFSALYDYRNRKSTKPLLLLANTIKGKGVSFMEKNIKWHHSVPNEKEFQVAMKELL